MERSRRGLALILRDKESQVLEKCFIPVLKSFSPCFPKTPTTASLPDPSQATPCCPGPHPGRHSFPTQLVTPQPTPRDTEETGYLRDQADWCHSHSHQLWPFNTALLSWKQPKESLTSRDSKPEPPVDCKTRKTTQRACTPPLSGLLPTQAPH
jgi:hypothetical protein